MNLMDMKRQHHHALSKAESIMRAAETASRELTADESMDFDTAMLAVRSLAPQIKKSESANTLSRVCGPHGFFPEPGDAPRGNVQRDNGQQPYRFEQRENARVLSLDYHEAFFGWLKSGGQHVDAALYEGSSPAGGYVVPIIVDQNIVPLAPPDMGVRLVATIIQTESDVKIPQKGSFGVAALKTESGASSNTFAETDPTLSQITLSAFMAGIKEVVSWELAQDSPNFQQFVVSDMLMAQQIFEENLYVNGSGSGQAQGLVGNVGTGVTGEVADANGNLLSIDATFDVMGTLKTPYFPGASWLMQRATAIELRKAQKQSNLFEPVFVRVGNVDYLHGFPVVYSASMPAIAAGATPVLFGDFRQGYVIADRGGSGINVKILDQVQAIQGQIVLLAYRRSDGRVRRSEAIQGITLHA